MGRLINILMNMIIYGTQNHQKIILKAFVQEYNYTYIFEFRNENQKLSHSLKSYAI